jgi:hypothetical protein
VARDTDNNKLHNEKTPQLTKDQRYYRLKRIVEIRLPQIQNRKCLRKSNIWRYRAENVFGNLISMILDRRGYQHNPNNNALLKVQPIYEN